MNSGKSLFEEGKYCVYLDQFALSNMFSESATEAWRDLRRILEDGVSMQVFICPRSNEHFIESSRRTRDKAIQQDRDFAALAGGYIFKPEVMVTSQLVSSIIRGNRITANTFFRKDQKGEILKEGSNQDRFQELHSEFDQKIQEATGVSNEIRKASKKGFESKEQQRLFFDAMKWMNVNRFIERLKEMLAKGTIRIEGAGFQSDDVPFWTDSLIYRLTEIHRFSSKEGKALVALLETSGFDQIPTLDIRYSLSANISVYQKVERVNDHIDLARIATGLPVSQFFLTDKQRKHEISELGLDVKYDSRVYCGVEKDVNDLCNDLSQVLEEE